MNRYRHIGEHRFRARGRDLDIFAAIVECNTVGERVLKVPEAGPECPAVSTSRSEIAVLNLGSQFTSRLSR